MNHILVVDDDPTIREVISEILEMSDYRVETAANGAEAFDLIRAEQPTAVLLDLMMPVMDGWQFLRQRQRESACAAIPVVVMSAVEGAAPIARRLGAQAFLGKPFELDAMLKLVGELTSGARRSGGGEAAQDD